MTKISTSYFVRVSILLISIAILIVFAVSSGRKHPAMEKESSDEFSCGTIDWQGKSIRGYERESEGKWYLFVPSAQNISELEIHYTGELINVSNGDLNTKKRVIQNAFRGNEDEVVLTMSDGTEKVLVVMQSNLPSVQISLKDVVLKDIHWDKEQKAYNNSFALTEPDGIYDLSVNQCVEIKGRGNTSWLLYAKRGYQIKFEDDISILGMEPARKWILLANASDDSMLRTKLVYEMAQNLNMEFVPEFKYVDLWIDGEYLGTYLLGEKVDIGNSRLDITQADGVLLEHDEGYYDEAEYGFYSKYLQRHFVLKESIAKNENDILNSMHGFETAIDEFASYLYSTPSSKVTLQKLREMIDVDSFAKYYLINEYVLNKEAFATSFFWYRDGADDIIHVGPIWDYDTCMGNDGSKAEESYGNSHILYQYLLSIPEFRERTEELYVLYKPYLSEMSRNAEYWAREICDSVKMNYLRWDVLGKKNPKEHAEPYFDTYAEAVFAVEAWLTKREQEFSIPNSKIVTSVIDDKNRSMIINFENSDTQATVKFAVMNDEWKPEEIKWYSAKYINGRWQSEVDLMGYQQEGMYRMDVYVNEDVYAAATGCNYIKVPYQLKTEFLEEQRKLIVSLKERIPCENIYFAIWSTSSEQKDMQWFPAEKIEEDVWEVVIDMTLYQNTGEYCIHAYTYNENESILRNITTTNIQFAVD